jgi:hypothetical protein
MRHTGPESELGAAEHREIVSRSRRLSAQLGAWLGAPLADEAPTDHAPAEVVEWMRRARDILDEVARDEP